MRLLSLVVLTIAALGISGCDRATAKTTAPPPPPPPEVYVTQPVEESVVDFEDYPGRLAATESVEVRSRVTGYLDKALFKDGDLVTAGKVLFQIDPLWYQAEFDRTAATVKQAQSRFDRMLRQEQRADELLRRKVMTPEAAEAAGFDRAESESALAVAKASHELAKLNLGYTKIAAKIDGRISRRLADPGNLIKADDTHLATIVSLNPLYAYFSIDERTLLRLQRMIREGKLSYSKGSEFPVQLALADEDDFTRTGRVTFLDNQIDPHTGTLAARAVVENPNGELSPGLFVRMRTPLGPPHSALLIPEEALGSDQGQRFVYVVDSQGQVAYRRVQVGQAITGRRVITEGLSRGERIIVTGLQRVRPGQKVSAKPFVTEAASVTVPPTKSP